jgi:hypothetical protein
MPRQTTTLRELLAQLDAEASLVTPRAAAERVAA